MELNQTINARLSLLVILFYVLLGYLIKDHVSLAFENDRAQREVNGMRLEVANGVYDRVVIKTRKVIVPTDKIVYVPPEGKVIITPKNPTKKLDDLVTIRYDRYGFTFEPGMQFTILPLGGGLDVKLAFINRLGLGVGVNYFSRGNGDYYISPTANVTYRLDFIRFVKNTEALFGLSVYPTNRGYIGIRMGL
jgi:hypothetical protein